MNIRLWQKYLFGNSKSHNPEAKVSHKKIPNALLSPVLVNVCGHALFPACTVISIKGVWKISKALKRYCRCELIIWNKMKRKYELSSLSYKYNVMNKREPSSEIFDLVLSLFFSLKDLRGIFLLHGIVSTIRWVSLAGALIRVVYLERKLINLNSRESLPHRGILFSQDAIFSNSWSN